MRRYRLGFANEYLVLWIGVYANRNFPLGLHTKLRL